MHRARLVAVAAALGASLGLTLGAGCRRAPGPVDAAQAEVLDRTGTFPSPGGAAELTVTVTPQGRMQWAVRDAVSRDVLAGGVDVSIHQRWFFVWDEAGRLWFHSSDVGTAVWAPADGGPWERRDLKPGTPLFAEMPRAFKEDLPSSLRRRWGFQAG